MKRQHQAKTRFPGILLAAFFLFLFACKKNEPAAPTATLRVSRTAIRLDSTAGVYDTLTVQSTGQWTAALSSGTASWLQLDQTSGGMGNTVVKLTVLSNNGTSTPQTATVTFATVNNSNVPPVILTVTQKPLTIGIGWKNAFGGTSDDAASASLKTTDGGIILAGFAASTDGDVSGNHGSYDMWVLKLDANGNKQWQKTLGGSGNESATSIAASADGGYVFAGSSNSTDGDVSGNHGNTDFWVVKLDANGNKQWQKTLGGTSDESATSIAASADGGFAVAGYTSSTDGDVSGNHGGYDMWVVKLDASGNKQWQKALGGSGPDGASSIIATTDGGFAVAGYNHSTDGDVSGGHGNADLWVVKLDASGNKQWQYSLGGSGADVAKSIIATPDGGYAVAGLTNSNDGDVSGNHGSNDYWVVKLDASGNKQWQKALGGSGDDEVGSIIATADGGFAVAGYTNSNDGDVSGNHGSYDCWVVKLNGSGNKQWGKTLGGSHDDGAKSIVVTADGGYAMAGYTNSINGDVSGNHGSYDMWVIKLAIQ